MRLLKIKKIVDMKMIFSKIPELYTIALKGEFVEIQFAV